MIRQTGIEMERSPKTYEAMGEEDRRHVLLTALNTHYVGAATAEAFNGNGKTDILVRHENKNLFIGECKVWSGAKAMSEAIDQLLSYETWRDAKLALVIFVREKDLSAVVTKARETLEAHPQFDSVKSKADTDLRARVRYRSDDARIADLAVLLFHAVPSARASKR